MSGKEYGHLKDFLCRFYMFTLDGTRSVGGRGCCLLCVCGGGGEGGGREKL